MGGFLLYDNNIIKPENNTGRLKKALEVFEKKVLPDSGKFLLGKYTLVLYKKKFFQNSTNWIKTKEGDFCASTGTLIYDGEYGKIALQKLLSDYKNGIKIEKHCTGNYFVVLYVNERFYIFRDYYGLYPVYSNDSMSIVSSSFLSVSNLLDKLSIAKEALYEYIFNGFWHGNKTIFSEIKLLASKGYFEIGNNISYHRFQINYQSVKGLTYPKIKEKIFEDLSEHFHSIIHAFDENIECALSGGYDTRLMLSILLYNKIHPHLYVNGTPASIDIQCAREITKSLNLSLKEVHFYDYYNNEIHQIIQNRFFYFDGLGTAGLFDNYSDLEYRLAHPNIDKVNLNGAGGEIYREAWNLPNRSFKMESYLEARYDKYDFSNILINFTKDEYLKYLGQQLAGSTYHPKNKLTRKHVENWHPQRYKAIHFILSAFQTLMPFLLPFYEPFLIMQSIEIPMKYKLNGRLNKDLLKRFYSELLTYESSYGYSFDKPIPLKYFIKEYLTRNTPLNLRPKIRKYQKSKKLPVEKYGTDMLNNDFVEKHFKKSELLMNEYLKVRNIESPGILSRTFTVEHFLRKTI